MAWHALLWVLFIILPLLPLLYWSSNLPFPKLVFYTQKKITFLHIKWHHPGISCDYVSSLGGVITSVNHRIG